MTAKFKRERERGGRRVGRVSAHTRQHVATNGQRPRELFRGLENRSYSTIWLWTDTDTDTDTD